MITIVNEQPIKETSFENIKSEMLKNNLAIFKDGHKEAILFYKDCPRGCIIFSTESGIYLYKPPTNPNNICYQPQYFYTIHLNFDHFGSIFELPMIQFVDDPYIKEIQIDRRVLRTIDIPGYKPVNILVKPDATNGEIALAIVEELGIKLDKNEEEKND